MIPHKYPKIETFYNRDKETFKVTNEVRLPEFSMIADQMWKFQEKIDGTNIRISYDENEVLIGGRTDRAQLPADLLENIRKKLSVERLTEVLGPPSPVNDAGLDLETPILFGEGYGPGIQKGGGDYRDDKGFILFDVRVGRWWLTDEDVQDIAHALDLPYVPFYQLGWAEIIKHLQKGTLMSLIAKTPRVAEGVIIRPKVQLLRRDGERVIAKLKCKDYQQGKR